MNERHLAAVKLLPVFALGLQPIADFEGTGVLFARGTSADGGTRVLGIAINGGSVEQLAFTGSSGNTRWMVGAAVALIIFGAGALFTGSRRQSLVG